MKEIFKDIKDYEGLYQISNLGRVKALAKFCKTKGDGIRYSPEKIMKTGNDIHGYQLIGMSKNTKRLTFKVHRLVAQAFIPNSENKPFINHKNGIKNDNNFKNLEWCTDQENMDHAVRTGLIKKGEDNPNSKLNEKDILRIRNEFKDFSISDVARKFNVDWNTIKRVITGDGWKHLEYQEKDKNIKYLNSLEYKEKTFCKYSNNKLSEKEVKEIIRLKGKRPQFIIAKYYNVNRNTIYNIHNGKTWKWLEAN